jgi:hypothetical protein
LFLQEREFLKIRLFEKREIFGKKSLNARKCIAFWLIRQVSRSVELLPAMAGSNQQPANRSWCEFPKDSKATWLGLRFWSFFLLLVCLCTQYSDPNCISKAYCS